MIKSFKDDIVALKELCKKMRCKDEADVFKQIGRTSKKIKSEAKYRNHYIKIDEKVK